MEAREKMHNAATCAGLGFGNALASMAHSMGHTLGAIFHVPHGCAVGIFLPYTIEYFAREAPERFAELASFVGVSDEGGEQGARALAEHIRGLCREIGSCVSVSDLDIERADYEAQLDKLIEDAFNDTQILTACRAPSYDELRQLFLYAYDGRSIDF
jgi:alcohol dehydrogenase class IV